MGLIKRQLLKVIEWSDMTDDTVCKRFTCPDRYAIMKGSMLVVRESQKAILVHKGQFADVYEPGTYKLDDLANIPVLSGLVNWKYAFETRWTAEVYFINTKQFINQKWGTQNPIMMRDKEFSMIRLRGFGVYSFRSDDIKKIITELMGAKDKIVTGDVSEHIKRVIVSRMSDAISESKIPALDLASNYDELSEYAKQKLAPDFEKFGLELCSFNIENLSLPEEVEKMLDTRTNMGILGDKMATYTQFKSANAIEEAAKNPSGGFAGAGVGMGVGMGLGHTVASAFSTVKDEVKKTCKKCGLEVPQESKFCPNCGERMTKVCQKCGEPLSEGAKFCPNCGEKLLKTCAKCGNEIDGSAKFCPSCGEKV